MPIPHEAPGKSRIAFIGRRQTPEFRELVDWLATAADSQYFKSVEAARRELTRSPPRHAIHAIILGQSRRGEFSASEVESLHGELPLARLAIVFGPWCEGETRTGRPLPGVVRWHWRQAVPRLAHELNRLTIDESWSQPRTATDFDRLLSHRGESAGPRREGQLAIGAASRTAFESIAIPCRSAGYTCLWLRDPNADIPASIQAVVWDGLHHPSPDESHEADALCALAQHARPAPVILMLGFPRQDHVDRSAKAGIADIVAKPFLAQDLLWRLDAAIAMARTPPSIERPT